MHRALQQTGRYSEQNFCAIPRPLTPLIQNHQLQNITAFERYRAIQNLDSQQSGLIILLHTPDQAAIKDRLQPDDYLVALLAEIALICKHLPGQPVLQQLHAYGDIALFSLQQLQLLFASLQKHLQLPSNNFAWFSIGIRPAESSWASLGKLRDAGFNRITLDCNEPRFQAAESLYEAARALQFNTITMRACYHPDGTAWASRHLQSMLRLQPDRIVLEQNDGSLYEQIPDARLADELQQAGYVAISSSCYVLPDDELTEQGSHETGPLETPLPVLGLGAGASSRLASLYYRNTSNLEQYIQNLSENRLPPARGSRV